MNYTEKHHLPQWVKTDRIMMDDFNAAMANIEEGLIQGPAEVAAAAAQANAATAQAAANARAAAANAQATADRAVTAAAAAQAKADNAYSPDQPPYAVGTYTGTGGTQNIVLGFRPRFVIIGASYGIYQNNYSRVVGAPGSGSVSFNSSGFSVGKNGVETGNGETPPRLVESGMVYTYIAFR